MKADEGDRVAAVVLRADPFDDVDATDDVDEDVEMEGKEDDADDRNDADAVTAAEDGPRIALRSAFDLSEASTSWGRRKKLGIGFFSGGGVIDRSLIAPFEAPAPWVTAD